MKQEPLEFMARREAWQSGVSLYARQPLAEGGSVIALPLAMQTHAEHRSMEPFARITIQEAQQLIDELWQCGLRPSEGTGSAGSLRATEKHLKDMRMIVGKRLNVELP